MERAADSENVVQEINMEEKKNVKIAQIENWFRKDEWGLMKELNEKERGPYPEKFFDTDVDVFWDYIDFMDLMGFALAYKKVAYFVYNYNKRGFRNFCDEIWRSGVLDLSGWQVVTLKSLRTLYEAFGIREILFPSYVPNEILEHLPDAKTFTFNLRWDRQYATPKHAVIRSVRLTINGCFCMNMADPLSPILNTFPRINSLTLNNVYFTRISIAALGTTKIKNLVITESSLWPSGDEAFVRALQNSADTIESIALESTSNCTWENVVKWLVVKIKTFKKLRSVTLTLRLNWRNMKSLRHLTVSRSIKNITLITNFYGRPSQSADMVGDLGKALEPVGILLNVVERDLENFSIFMRNWNNI